jgi:hypothetical protein
LFSHWTPEGWRLLYESFVAEWYTYARGELRRFYQKQKIHKRLFSKIHQYILTPILKNIKNGRLVKHGIFIQKHSNAISEKAN